ncbi:MAG: 30S ribosomal protein S20 [bacterium]
MGQIQSAKKRHRQNLVRSARNRAVRSRFRNAVKKVLTSIEAGEVAPEDLRAAQSLLARAAQKGVLHRKTASRKAGRLARKVHKAASGGAK